MAKIIPTKEFDLSNIAAEKIFPVAEKIPTKTALMLILYSMQKYNKKTYSWMSLLYISKQLYKKYDINITISAIKWQLKTLSDKGLTRYFKNNCGRRKNGTIFRRPSNRLLTIPGLVWMEKQGLKIVAWLWDHLTHRKKLPRGNGPNGLRPKPTRETKDADLPEEVLKLIPDIGKSFT